MTYFKRINLVRLLSSIMKYIDLIKKDYSEEYAESDFVSFEAELINYDSSKGDFENPTINSILSSFNRSDLDLFLAKNNKVLLLTGPNVRPKEGGWKMLIFEHGTILITCDKEGEDNMFDSIVSDYSGVGNTRMFNITTTEEYKVFIARLYYYLVSWLSIFWSHPSRGV